MRASGREEVKGTVSQYKKMKPNLNLQLALRRTYTLRIPDSKGPHDKIVIQWTPLREKKMCVYTHTHTYSTIYMFIYE